MATVYRVKQRSYINGHLLDPGALVVLPAGVGAGGNLEATEEAPGSPGVILPRNEAAAAAVYNPAAPEQPVEEAKPAALDLLDGTVSEIKAKFAELSVQDLQDLKAAEEAGKTRKSLIDAIETELSSRLGGEF